IHSDRGIDGNKLQTPTKTSSVSLPPLNDPKPSKLSPETQHDEDGDSDIRIIECRAVNQGATYVPNVSEADTETQRLQMKETLAASTIIPMLFMKDANRLVQYFVLSERVCTDTATLFGERGASCSGSTDDMDIVVVDENTSPEKPKSAWNRLELLYREWTELVPEMNLLAAEDRKAQATDRLSSCIWLHLAYLHAVNPHKAASADVWEAAIALAGSSAVSNPQESFDFFLKTLVKPMRDLQVTEEEYALLRIITLFHQSIKLTCRGREIVRDAKEKYLKMFAAHVVMLGAQRRIAEENVTFRAARLISFLMSVERAAHPPTPSSELRQSIQHLSRVASRQMSQKMEVKEEPGTSSQNDSKPRNFFQSNLGMLEACCSF
ncbi:hypothetical protein AAVH_38555, partial [Aphelenchoides avenae]